MDNLNDLKKIWLTADTRNLPESTEILRMVKGFRNKKLIKITALVLGGVILTALMVVVVFIYKSNMVTSRIGEGCIIIACILLTATNINSLNRFYKLKDLNNKEFIRFLEHTRVRQNFYYKRTQVLCLALYSAGLLLYMYELVYKDIILLVATYTFTVAYILILWLVIRPRMFKKEAKKLNTTMEKLERISNQL